MSKCPICDGLKSQFHHPLSPENNLPDDQQECLTCGLKVKYWSGVKGNPPLTSDEAIQSIYSQTALCLQMGAEHWPQIDPEYCKQFLREIAYWRHKAGLLPERKKDERSL